MPALELPASGIRSHKAAQSRASVTSRLIWINKTANRCYDFLAGQRHHSAGRPTAPYRALTAVAKTFVIKEPDGDRTPFLRGILVQSLMNAGLPFQQAYSLAQQVRAELQNTEELTSGELKRRVAELLSEQCGPQYRSRYESEPPRQTETIIHTPTRSEPFSVGVLARSLESCAIPPETALDGARKVQASLQKLGHREIDHITLRRIIYRCLKEHCSADAADRYLSWRRFENSGEPLIVLIGGATGSGKSTVSSDIAYRMEIARIQSTDMMREIIRAYLTPQAAPTLAYSSFEAWHGLPEQPDTGDSDDESPIIAGFLSQFYCMKPALEAAINRAAQEHHDLIIEGVHIVPTMLDLDRVTSKAMVVPLMLAVMQKKALRKQLKRRGREKTERQAGRYLQHLDDIWELQSYLLSEADNAGIPIITNWHVEDTVREILNLVSAKVMKRYPPRLHKTDLGG